MYDRNYIYTVQHCKLMVKNKEIWSFNVRTYLTGVNKLEEFGKVSIFTSVFNDVYPCVEEFCVDLAEAEKKVERLEAHTLSTGGELWTEEKYGWASGYRWEYDEETGVNYGTLREA